MCVCVWVGVGELCGLQLLVWLSVLYVDGISAGSAQRSVLHVEVVGAGVAHAVALVWVVVFVLLVMVALVFWL